MLVIPTLVPAMAMVVLAMLVLATLVLAMLAMLLLATLMLLSPLDPALDWTPSPRDLTL